MIELTPYFDADIAVAVVSAGWTSRHLHAEGPGLDEGTGVSTTNLAQLLETLKDPILFGGFVRDCYETRRTRQVTFRMSLLLV